MDGLGPIRLNPNDLVQIEPYKKCIKECDHSRLSFNGCYSFSICPSLVSLDPSYPEYPACHLRLGKFTGERPQQELTEVRDTKCVTIYHKCEEGIVSMIFCK